MPPLFPVILGAIAMVLAVVAGKDCWLARRIARLQTTAISSLRPGFRKVQGTVRGLGELLEGPLTRRACLGYRFIVDEEQNQRSTEHGTDTVWRTVVDDRRMVPVEVDDGTGGVPMDLRLADLRLEVDARARSGFLNNAPPELRQLLHERYGRSTRGLLFNKTMRYSEVLLEEGDRLIVIGSVVASPDGRLRFTRQGDVFLVWDRGETALLEELRWRAKRYAAGAACFLVPAVVLPFVT
jgi:hypothetical protein